MRFWMLACALIAWLTTAFFVCASDVRDIAVEISPRAATQRFLAALTLENRDLALGPFDSDERLNWDYVPRSRKGLTFAAMAPSEREHAHSLLSSLISHRNAQLCREVIGLETVLHGLEEAGGFDASHRNPELYYFSVFGSFPEEGSTEPYAVRVEGHHLSLNFTLRGDEFLSRTPLFLGANPADRGALAPGDAPPLAHIRAAFESLVDGLDEQSRAAAKGADKALSEVLFRPGVAVEEPELGLVIEAEPNELSARCLAIRSSNGPSIADPAVLRPPLVMRGAGVAGPRPTRLAYAGSTKPGAGLYVRITFSDHLVIEYCNVQNAGNHIHLLVRDQDDDFAAKSLADHLDDKRHK